MTLHPFVSRPDTLRAKISSETWKAHGLSVFGTEGVPFANFTGSDYATKLVALLIQRATQIYPDQPNEDIHVYEYGVGTGLLSKRMLDILKAEFPDFYSKIKFHLSDISVPLMKSIMNLDLFAQHRDQVVFEIVDAVDPSFSKPPFMVFHTYLADSLPTRHIRIVEGKAYEVKIKTTLDTDQDYVDTSFFPPKVLTQNDLKKITDSNRLTDKLPLFWQLTKYSEESTKLVSINSSIKDKAELKDLKALLKTIKTDGCFNYSYPLRNSTARTIDKLLPGGILVISDFGRLSIDNIPEQLLVKSWGAVCAYPVSFPTITNQLISKDHQTYLTDQPAGHAQTLLIDTQGQDPKMDKLFNQLFLDNNREDINSYLDLFAQASKGQKSSARRFAKLKKSLPIEFAADFQLNNNLAQHYLNANLPDEAIETANEVLIDHAHIALTTYRIKGMAEAQLGRLENMESTFKSAIELAPTDYQSMAFLSELYWKQQRFSDFADIMTHYLKWTQNSDWIKALFYTIQGLGQSNSLPGAIKLARHTIEFSQKLKHLSDQDQQHLRQLKKLAV